MREYSRMTGKDNELKAKYSGPGKLPQKYHHYPSNQAIFKIVNASFLKRAHIRDEEVLKELEGWLQLKSNDEGKPLHDNSLEDEKGSSEPELEIVSSENSILVDPPA